MKSEYKAILLEKKKGVATITLNQPENLNLMTEHLNIMFADKQRIMRKPLGHFWIRDLLCLRVSEAFLGSRIKPFRGGFPLRTLLFYD